MFSLARPLLVDGMLSSTLRWRFAAPVALVGFLLAACGGGTAGGGGGTSGSGTDGGSETDGASGRSFRLGNLDAKCQSLTGRQLVDLLAPSYSGTISPGGGKPVGLTITATYNGGTITCTPMGTGGCCAGCPCALAPTQIDVEIDVTFTTSDGAFDEHLAATATLLGNTTQANWSAKLPLAQLHGSYKPPSWTTYFEFDGDFTTSMMSGGISELSSKESTGVGDWTVTAGTTAVDAGKD